MRAILKLGLVTFAVLASVYAYHIATEHRNRELLLQTLEEAGAIPGLRIDR